MDNNSRFTFLNLKGEPMEVSFAIGGFHGTVEAASGGGMAFRMKELVDAINCRSQCEIDTLKSRFPGLGIGPFVQQKLADMILDGTISKSSEIPEEYRQHLSHLLG